ncbi:MAG TPA: TatD family hydrolase [Solirubrobacteraceae bacterium]|nr:TatD family hydrolase [Solirubrobacteraceae bacterium]
MAIHTVLGPIAASELGPTTMHEHLLSDLRLWSRPSAEPPPDGDRVHPGVLGYLRWNALSMPDNLLLDDPDEAIAELQALRAAGGRALVDLTLEGMGRRLEELPRIARESGVTICVGCGWYVDEAQPDWVRDADEDRLAEHMIGELNDGIAGTGIRPALIGEIGTNHPPTEREWRVLRAAARAAVETGAAVNVHLSWRGADGVAVLEALVAAGMRPERVILSHMDERLDRGYHKAVAEAGAVLEYDTFGSDFLYGTPAARNPSDAERLDMTAWLLSEGHGDQLVIACDTWTKANLRRNGGYGYEHLFKRIVPALSDYCGADAATVERILVATPRRLLDR